MTLNDAHHFFFTLGEPLRIDKDARAGLGMGTRIEGKFRSKRVAGAHMVRGYQAACTQSAQWFGGMFMRGQDNYKGSGHAGALQREAALNIAHSAQSFAGWQRF